MKKFFSAMRNSFSLSDSPEPDVRLAATEEPANVEIENGQQIIRDKSGAVRERFNIETEETVPEVPEPPKSQDFERPETAAEFAPEVRVKVDSLVESGSAELESTGGLEGDAQEQAAADGVEKKDVLVRVGKDFTDALTRVEGEARVVEGEVLDERNPEHRQHFDALERAKVARQAGHAMEDDELRRAASEEEPMPIGRVERDGSGNPVSYEPAAPPPPSESSGDEDEPVPVARVERDESGRPTAYEAIGGPEREDAPSPAADSEDGDGDKLKSPQEGVGRTSNPQERRRPREVVSVRPGLWERMSHGAQEVMRGVLGDAGDSFIDHLRVRWHDDVRNWKLGPVIRNKERVQKYAAKVEEYKALVEQYKGTGQQYKADWYGARMRHTQEKMRNAERDLRKYNDQMEHHAERRNNFLRKIEATYKERLAPFERWGEKEQALHDQAGQVRERLGTTAESARERLAEVEGEIRSRSGFGGLFLSVEDRRRVEEMRGRVRRFDEEIARVDGRMANRRARMIRAQGKADVWRTKIANLNDWSKNPEVPEFEVPPSEVARIRERGGVSSPETQTTAEAEQRRFGVEGEPEMYPLKRFVEEWNESNTEPAQSLDEDAFQEAMEHRTGDGEDATIEDLSAVARQLLIDAGIRLTPRALRQRVSLAKDMLEQ